MIGCISDIVIDLIGLVFVLFMLNSTICFLFGFDVVSFLVEKASITLAGRGGKSDDEEKKE